MPRRNLARSKGERFKSGSRWNANPPPVTWEGAMERGAAQATPLGVDIPDVPVLRRLTESAVDDYPAVDLRKAVGRVAWLADFAGAKSSVV